MAFEFLLKRTDRVTLEVALQQFISLLKNFLKISKFYQAKFKKAQNFFATKP